MTYGEAMETLIDGVRTHEQKDIVAYGTVRRFYIDLRTEYRQNPLPDKVWPLGRTINNYWLYVCPDCGLIHAVHNNQVKFRKPIVCGCDPNTTRKRNNYRQFIQSDRHIGRVPKKKIMLMCEGSDQNNGKT